jgi:Flp pilus assembly protein TadG
MIRLNKLIRSQKGQSIVELALILPIIIIILFGIIEFGRIFYSYIVITNAAREGARLGSVGKSDIEITEKIKQTAPLPQSEQKLKITRLEPSEASRSPGLPLTVEVSYDVDIITPFFSSFIPNPFTLRAQAVMRIE